MMKPTEFEPLWLGADEALLVVQQLLSEYALTSKKLVMFFHPDLNFQSLQYCIALLLGLHHGVRPGSLAVSRDYNSNDHSLCWKV
jgi:hypothetical protein